MPVTPFKIGGHEIAAGSGATIDLTLGSFSNHMPASMPVRVVHGRRPGPTMFVSAAIHGDEIIGVEIVRRLLQSKALDSLRGTLIAVPIVNTFGFVSRSRYLPDRRDLNRHFPGTERGSLAAQLANLFMNEIVANADFGIDLHSAAEHRQNLPQIRISPDNEKTSELAEVFGAPLILESPLRDGSLRQAAKDMGVDVLLFEAGEAFRFNEFGVRVGVRGILDVMAHLGMVRVRRSSKKESQSLRADRSKWLRAPMGGVFRAIKDAGDLVDQDEVLGYVSDPFGDEGSEVRSPYKGIVIGLTRFPICNPGDPLFHIALLRPGNGAQSQLDQIEDNIQSDPLFDEDEII